MKNLKQFEGFVDETNDPAKNSLMRKKSNKAALVQRGLSDVEAGQFLELLDKIKLTSEDTAAFDKEMGEGIPFEGGMGFTEALCGLKMDA